MQASNSSDVDSDNLPKMGPLWMSTSSNRVTSQKHKLIIAIESHYL